MYGSERADPAAGHPSQHKGDDDGRGGKDEGKEDGPRSDESSQSKEWIEMEKDLHSSDIIPSWKTCLQQKI
jgi:hypothetical protein